jgi:hypothetical protein
MSGLEDKPQFRVKRKPRRCKNCGSTRVATLVFGLQPKPSPDLQAKIDAGKVILAGCCYPDPGADPIWACSDCDAGYAQEFDFDDPFANEDGEPTKSDGPSNLNASENPRII